MREKICTQEMAVARAARTGLWDGALRDHAAGCAACKDLVTAVSAVQSLAAGFEKNAELPDAGWLWRKALLEQKQTEADRAQRPLRVAQFASVPAIVLAFAAWIGWYWPQMQAQVTVWQAGLWPRLWQAFWSVVAGTTQLSPGPFLLVLLLAIAAVLVAHPLLAEE